MTAFADATRPHAPMIRQQRQLTYEDTTKLLGDQPLTRDLLTTAVGSAHTLIDRSCDAILARLAERSQRPGCREGCSHCCYQPSMVTTPEVAMIAALTHQEDWPAVLDRAARTVARTGHLMRDNLDAVSEARYKGALPCAFLEGNRCGIHALRPQACRTHFSFSRHACDREWAARLRTPEARARLGGVPQVTVTKSIGFATMAGVDQALHERGLEVEVVELTEAALVILQPGALDDWLGGARLFQGSRYLIDGRPYSELLAKAG